MEYLKPGDIELSYLPHVYFARMDVDPPGLRAFMDWYEDKHAPDTISVGFYSAQGYHCRVGKPFICNVYEIESSEIFYTSEYQTMRTPEQDPQRPAILETVSNRSNTVYSQVAVMTDTRPKSRWTDGGRESAVDGAAITTIRFDVAADDEDAVVEWILNEEMPASQAIPELRAFRLCRQHGRLHPANPSGEPQWTVIREWDDQESAESSDSQDKVSERLAGAPFDIKNSQYNLAVRVLSLRDRPATDEGSAP